MFHHNWAAVFCILTLTGCEGSSDTTEDYKVPTFAEQYPGPWRLDTPEKIITTLASNNISGCGEFKYREASESPNEFLVYCSRDGKNWNSYLVWTSANEVMGPYATDPTLPPEENATAVAAQAETLADEAEAAALAAAEAAQSGSVPDVQATPSASAGQEIANVEMLEDYTRNNAFDPADVYWIWKVAIIPKDTSQKES